jgi:hypothetical protein
MTDDDIPERTPKKRVIVTSLMADLGFPIMRLALAGKCSAPLSAPAQRTFSEREDMTCRLTALYSVRGEHFCRRHAASEVFSFLTGDEGAQ